MKKTNVFLILLMAVMVSVSCADDNDFENLIGTWEHPPLADSESRKLLPTLPDECERKIITTFNKNLTGALDKDNYCYSDYESAGFKWSIKGNELTIIFDKQSPNNWNVLSGKSWFSISGNKLTIVNEDGIVTVLKRELKYLD